MTDTAPLVAPSRLALHRHRARRKGGDFFLHQEARAEIEDRVSMVNKEFTRPAIITGFPELWSDWFPNATVVEDTDTLTLTEGAHDLVIHAMCLHWANDPVGQLIQCNRALVPDGLMLAVFPADQTLNELRSALAQAEVEVTGGLSPRVLPMGELSDLGGLIQRASFALPVADKLTRRVTYPHMMRLVDDLRAMGETSALSRGGKPMTRALLARTAEVYAEHFSEDDRLVATFDLVALTGWAPDASQPKPLRRGSAHVRLADALNTREFNLPDATP